MSTHTDPPKFATAMRGYDRLQVDDFLARVLDIAADAEERAQLAEAELEFSRHVTVGPRVSQILDLAVEEAKELRERVDAEVELTRSHARSQCEEMVAQARETSAQMRTEAETTRSDILADADAERLAVLAEVDRLSRSREALLCDLERIKHVISQATSIELPALPAGDAQAVDEAATAESAGVLIEAASD